MISKLFVYLKKIKKNGKVRVLEKKIYHFFSQFINMMLELMQFAQGLRNYLLGLGQGSSPMVEPANRAKRWLVAILMW